jgi:hypothetical protein
MQFRSLFLLIPALLISGCGKGADIGDASDPDQSPLPSVSPTPVSTGLLRAPAGPDYPLGWERYFVADMGVSFAFPPMPDPVRLEIENAQGGPGDGGHPYVTISWRRQALVGAAAHLSTAGRECTVLDAFDWEREGSNVRVLYPKAAPNCPFLVEPIEIYTNDDDLEAVVFDLGQFFEVSLPPDSPPNESQDLVAILKHPAADEQLYKAVTFVFDIDDDRPDLGKPLMKGLDLEDLRIVLDSVEPLEG